MEIEEEIDIYSWIHDSEGAIGTEGDLYRVYRVSNIGYVDRFESPTDEKIRIHLRGLRDNIDVIKRLNTLKELGLKFISLEQALEITKERNKERVALIEKYIVAAKEMFPGKAVFTFESDEPHLYLLTDEETVTDDNGLHTTIRDFVFKIKFNSSLTSIANIKGQIYKATDKQARAYYSHSHVSSNAMTGWGDCCFGNTPLSHSFHTLQMGLDIDTFELFLFQLQNYLKHESIKGGPYQSISTLNSGGDSGLDVAPSYFELLMSAMASRGNNPIINIEELDGSLSCTFDRDSLSDNLIKSGIDARYVGKLTNGLYQALNSDGEITSRSSYFTDARGISVSDDTCSIELNKTIHLGEEDSSLGTMDYVNPRFMDVFERTEKLKIEEFLTKRILENEEN